MSKEHTSIHDFDINLICEYYAGLERQGPGSMETTAKALSFIDGLDKNSRIVDIGCGTGAPTRDLAKHVPSPITGIDLFPVFIDRFNQTAEELGLSDRVRGVVGDMEDLPFREEELDLIWSEGAIYNIGFERGMKEWRKFLKSGGYIAVTEACWFTLERPREIEDFWNAAYPEIDLISVKLAQMEKAGYVPVASFILPEECWEENFHQPQVEWRKTFLEQHPGNKTAEDFVANEVREAELYKKYSNYYGYVFFIGRKM